VKSTGFVLLWLCMVPNVMAGDILLYAGASVGESNMGSGDLKALIDDGATANFSYDKSSLSYELLLGARLHKNVYAELSYADLGGFEVEGAPVASATQSVTGDVDISILKISLMANKHINRSVNFYLRGGLHQSRAKSQATLQFSDSQSGSGIHYGIGAGFILSSQWQVQLDWTRYNDIDYTILHTGEDGSAEVDALTVRWLRMF